MGANIKLNGGPDSFTKAPVGLLLDNRLAGDEKILYLLMTYCAWKYDNYIPQELLAKLLDVTRKTISVWQKRLITCGWIHKEKLDTAKQAGNKNSRNKIVYYLNPISETCAYAIRQKQKRQEREEQEQAQMAYYESQEAQYNKVQIEVIDELFEPNEMMEQLEQEGRLIVKTEVANILAPSKLQQPVRAEQKQTYTNTTPNTTNKQERESIEAIARDEGVMPKRIPLFIDKVLELKRASNGGLSDSDIRQLAMIMSGGDIQYFNEYVQRAKEKIGR